LFILVMAYFLASANTEANPTLPTRLGLLLASGITELVVGGLMAFGIFTAFSVFQVGGRVLDMQMGFGVANMIDPATNTQAPMLGTILELFAVMMFFAVDGHLLMIKGIAYSLQMVPPGSAFSSLNFSALIKQFGLMFIYGVAVVAAPLFGILLLDIGLGVVARTMPQVNIFIVSLPLKIFVGLILLAVSMSYMPPLLVKIFESIFQFWEEAMV